MSESIYNYTRPYIPVLNSTMLQQNILPKKPIFKKYQNKSLRSIVRAPRCYNSNRTIHKDLNSNTRIDVTTRKPSCRCLLLKCGFT